MGDDIESVSVACTAAAKFKGSLVGLCAESKLPCVVIDGSKSCICKRKMRIKVESELIACNRCRQVTVEALLFPLN